MSIKLSSGYAMPLVGFGLWKVDNATCADTVYNAIKAGYRLFDGACDYGNEKEAGQGMRRAIDEGLVQRKDLFLTTKLWNTFHAPEHVGPACRRQLEEYGLGYIDLYLMHFPVALKYVDPSTKYPPSWSTDLADVPIQATWQAMEGLVKDGIVRSIGISNFQGSLILDLLRYAKIQPAVLQVEHHPYLTQPALMDLCKLKGIAVTAYSSFGPSSFVELGWAKALTNTVLFEHKTVTGIASAHKKTPAQVLLRWATQRGIAVIPKSNNKERLVQNLQCTDFNLDTKEIEEISKLNFGLRFNDPADYMKPPISIFA